MAHQRYSPDHDACGVGFVTRLGGSPSHEIVERALTALLRLAHRGGVDADGRSGDGAGLLMAIPDRFMRAGALQEGFTFRRIWSRHGLFASRRRKRCAGRDRKPSPAKRPAMPGLARGSHRSHDHWSRAHANAASHATMLLRCGAGTADLETALFRLRKQVEAQAPRGTYFCSLSSRTVVYKGLLTPDQFPAFYLDLADPAFETSFAIFHQRYSTNTQPSWALAQPFRFVAHNGEINTISANRRWLHAKTAA